MSQVIFKVILRGNELDESLQHDSMTLSFKNILNDNIIKIPSHYLSSIKAMSEKFDHIINFQNLEEVITIGDFSMEYTINYYIVILYSMKSEEKKKGYLIANIKKIGEVLIGIWPFTEEIATINEENIREKFNDFIKNYDKYRNLVIINPN
jgi:hypothetical protein